jgi:hypothetical protein
MLYNWRTFALNELFAACGYRGLSEVERRSYDLFGVMGVSRLRRACYSYNGKTSQLSEIKERIGEDKMMVVDYDELVKEKERALPVIYEFIDLPYDRGYLTRIHAKSVMKASNRLSKGQFASIDELCTPVYEKARMLISDTMKKGTILECTG